MPEAWRTVRVFISSTFRDMQAERDHLVRFVFPRLREELLKRRIHLVDVDLRWGVTSEQDALEVCREIIDECRPRFICILGGRYGWVPPGREHSITADEVRYGVLDRLDEKWYRYFYLRREEATSSISEGAARAGARCPETHLAPRMPQQPLSSHSLPSYVPLCWEAPRREDERESDWPARDRTVARLLRHIGRVRDKTPSSDSKRRGSWSRGGLGRGTGWFGGVGDDPAAGRLLATQ